MDTTESKCRSDSFILLLGSVSISVVHNCLQGILNELWIVSRGNFIKMHKHNFVFSAISSSACVHIDKGNYPGTSDLLFKRVSSIS